MAQAHDPVEEFLSTLSPDEQLALLGDWSIWRRPAQTPPEGEDWLIWILLSGRGFGKTRVGAEEARRAVNKLGCRRLHLVARTAADARDTMVEGDSGVLAVCSCDLGNIPQYIPSKRRIEWPNGAQALLLSGEKPDALRGPQTDWWWADELCLEQTTRIVTERGEVPICHVRAGDRVWTRKGFRRVLRAGVTGYVNELRLLRSEAGHELIGTGGHPIWTRESAFLPLRSVSAGDTLLTWDTSQNQVSSGMESGTGSMGVTTAIGEGDSCTGQSTPPQTDRFQMDWKSTIRTAIDSITTWATWKPFPVQSTCPVIDTEVGGRFLPQSVPNTAERSGISGSLGRVFARIVGLISRLARPTPITARGGASQLRIVRTAGTPKLPFVSIAENLSSTCGLEKLLPHDIVPTPACRVALSESAALSPALSAGNGSGSGLLKPCAVLENVGIYYGPDSVPVYNLEVEDSHEFVANGVLVHNCSWKYPQETWDMLQFGARLGDRVRGIVTTTPKPIPLLKKLVDDSQRPNSRIRVTTGHTYDNAANLAPSFILEMRERYEGTRLGMQELEGRLISDDPMAMWRRDDIENNRVREPDIPHLITMGVGVDPAMSSKADSDATGIVIVGMDSRRPAHYYVLNDVTANRASPDRWGRIVVSAYEEYKVLCAHTTIFPEVNNGGEMVTNTLRTIDESLPIDTVYASVGKDVRANPVVALYEQGRVHHVGTFPEMEDEMCQWVPGESKWSPNRLDALVWAITGQMQKNRGFALPLGNIIPPV